MNFWGSPKKKEPSSLATSPTKAQSSAMDFLVLPTVEAGAFYEQLNKDIDYLRQRVDEKLRGMVESSQQDLKILNTTLQELKIDESLADGLINMESPLRTKPPSLLAQTRASQGMSVLDTSDSNVTEPAANLSRNRGPHKADLSPNCEAKIIGIIKNEPLREEDEAEVEKVVSKKILNQIKSPPVIPEAFSFDDDGQNQEDNREDESGLRKEESGTGAGVAEEVTREERMDDDGERESAERSKQGEIQVISVEDYDYTEEYLDNQFPPETLEILDDGGRSSSSTMDENQYPPPAATATNSSLESDAKIRYEESNDEPGEFQSLEMASLVGTESSDGQASTPTKSESLVTDAFNIMSPAADYGSSLVLPSPEENEAVIQLESTSEDESNLEPAPQAPPPNRLSPEGLPRTRPSPGEKSALQMSGSAADGTETNETSVAHEPAKNQKPSPEGARTRNRPSKYLAFNSENETAELTSLTRTVSVTDRSLKDDGFSRPSGLQLPLGATEIVAEQTFDETLEESLTGFDPTDVMDDETARDTRTGEDQDKRKKGSKEVKERKRRRKKEKRQSMRQIIEMENKEPPMEELVINDDGENSIDNDFDLDDSASTHEVVMAPPVAEKPKKSSRRKSKKSSKRGGVTDITTNDDEVDAAGKKKMVLTVQDGTSLKKYEFSIRPEVVQRVREMEAAKTNDTVKPDGENAEKKKAAPRSVDTPMPESRPAEIPPSDSMKTKASMREQSDPVASKSRRQSPSRRRDVQKGKSKTSSSDNRKAPPSDVKPGVVVQQVQNRVVKDPYGDSGQFTGTMVGEKPHGEGTMLYSDGRTYTGGWKQGRWHGKGRATFLNGDKYEGEYEKDKRHGTGRYEWADGRIYDGGFQRDHRHGYGTYKWSDGAQYTGEFHHGHRQGQGKYCFSDGSVYDGAWANGKYHGFGECTWADGRRYEGEWDSGQAHGHGIEHRPDGSIRHEGEWRRDRPVRRKLEP